MLIIITGTMLRQELRICIESIACKKTILDIEDMIIWGELTITYTKNMWSLWLKVIFFTLTFLTSKLFIIEKTLT